jgi:hypothetical protein
VSGSSNSAQGLVNQLLPQQAPQAAYLGPTSRSPIDPSYTMGDVYQVPKFNPPGTYTGVIPNQSQSYGPTTLQLPHDYYTVIGALKQSGQYTPQMDQWLQSAYLQAKGRT